MKKYVVQVPFSLDKMLYLPNDEFYGENVGGPVYRLYNPKTRKTVGTMVYKDLKDKCKETEL